jgi:hypothetical protein
MQGSLLFGVKTRTSPEVAPRHLSPDIGGCGLFRAATLSSVPLTGAENSVGYGGSPWVQALRSA